MRWNAYTVLFGRVDRELGRGQSEDRPALAGVDMCEERAIGIRIGAVDDRVSADDHGSVCIMAGLAI